MIIFYSDRVQADSLELTPEDSQHCAKVLRHREGDAICAIDGLGTMYECTVISANPKCVSARIDRRHSGWNSHPYRLVMAVCPTKNNDRFEWFVEKAVEIGVDRIVPLIGERSERKVYKTERAGKIAVSAAKQSLKAVVPEISEPVSVKEFIRSVSGGNAHRFIAYCFDDPSMPRISMYDRLCGLPASESAAEIVIMIGPEGDFSPAEASFALENGFVPVHLGDSRLRTETAAMVATTMVYSVLGK